MFITQTTHTPFTIEDAQKLKTAYDEVMAAVNDAKTALDRAKQAARSVGGYTTFRLERAEKRVVVAEFWRALIRSLPAYAVMSEKRKEMEEDWVGSRGYNGMGRYPHNFPAFSIPNILEKAAAIEGQYTFFLQEWALTIYRQHAPRFDEAHEIRVPQKVSEQGVLDSEGVKYGYQMRQFIELDRFFHHLDGRPLNEATANRNMPFITAIAEARKAGRSTGETDYFKFRLYSSAMHLTFKRRDLVAEWERLAREGFNQLQNY